MVAAGMEEMRRHHGLGLPPASYLPAGFSIVVTGSSMVTRFQRESHKKRREAIDR
jgi:hypothetical protein